MTTPKAASGALEHKARAMFCSPRRCCGYSSGRKGQSEQLPCPACCGGTRSTSPWSRQDAHEL